MSIVQGIGSDIREAAVKALAPDTRPPHHPHHHLARGDLG